ncbi:alpha/beta hydrolase [Micromonospora ureilytica]|uniref:alpha/beta hydrolase n=1 Tax=Micromonospora ureilytica TaxID=709868 RepID=UPI002E1107AE|nr:alpha/beta hydrolase [Micromonospora ureilytica]
MRRFYDQKLTFGSCTDFATTESDAEFYGRELLECARLEVPLDYGNPKGRTAQLAVMRVRATGERQGALVVNPGGPAAPGTSFAAILTGTPGYARLGEHFDIVGFDMRGTGASTPTVDCLSDEERDGDDLVATWFFGGDSWDAATTKRVAEQCAAGSGGADVISHLGSRDSARDIDVLRAVIGEEKLNFLGASYGTRLGAVYAEMFPSRVRSMVLDGGIDPNLDTPARMEQQYGGFEAAFRTMAAACATAKGCPLGTDPALVDQRFQELVRPLVDRPVPVAGGRSLTYRAAMEAVLFSLYNPAGWPTITTGLAELKAGKGETLLAARDRAHQRQSDGSYSTFLEGSFATHCNDKERMDPEAETAMRRRMLAAAPFMDDGKNRSARDSCESWPSEPTLGYPYATGIKGLPATLVVSVTGDPAAPYDGSAVLAKILGARHVTVEGSQHGAAYVAENTCVDDIVNDYLIDLTLPPANARCTL